MSRITTKLQENRKDDCMKKLKIIIFCVISLSLVGCGVRQNTSDTSSKSNINTNSFDNFDFKKIKVGDRKTDVIDLLGKPTEIDYYDELNVYNVEVHYYYFDDSEYGYVFKYVDDELKDKFISKKMSEEDDDQIKSNAEDYFSKLK